MLNTDKNTAAKDQAVFFLILLTGIVAGSIFTLAYIKYDVKTTLSFADIGGMLAGVGTIGLLILACFTAKSWKEQIIESAKRKSLEQFYVAGTNAFWTMMFFLRKLEDIENAKRQGYLSTVIQDQTRDKNAEAIIEYQNAIEQINVSWGINKFSEVLPKDILNIFNEIEKLHKEEIFETASKKSLKRIEHFQDAFHETYEPIKKRL